MRTHLLIAAALALSATTAASAAPRSLSTPQSSPVQTETPKPIEAPVFKVQSGEETRPAKQPQAAPAPAPAPVQAAPATAPDAGPARAVDAKADEDGKPVHTAKRVKRTQLKKKQRPVTVEQRINRDLKSIERSLGRIGVAGAIGAAGVLGSIPYTIPGVVYW